MGKCQTIKNILAKIHIHLFFYITAFICVLTGYFYEFSLFTYLILIHELGHVLAGIYFKWNIKEIIILPFGGLTKFEELLNKPIIEEFIITIMGPIFQIIGYYILKCKVDSSLFTFFNNAIFRILFFKYI